MRSKIIHHILLFGFFLTFIGPFPALAIDDTTREYRIKAGLIYKLIHFVEYPKDTALENSQLFIIGIAGKNPFGKEMEMLNGKIVNNKRIEIRYFSEAKDLSPCQVLFIRVSDNGQLENILEKVKGLCVLTISDMAGFAAKGVMINFITINNKIRFEVNLAETRQARLKISSRFLKLARIINEND